VDWRADAYALPVDPVQLANLMYVVYALTELNERQVVVGYTGLWGILPMAAGATAVATGWHLASRRMTTRKFEQVPSVRRAALRRVWVRDVLAELTSPELALLCLGCPPPPPGTGSTMLSAYTHEESEHFASPEAEVCHNWSVLSTIDLALGSRPVADRTTALLTMIQAAQGFFSTHCNSTSETQRYVSHLDNWATAIGLFRSLAGFTTL